MAKGLRRLLLGMTALMTALVLQVPVAADAAGKRVFDRMDELAETDGGAAELSGASALQYSDIPVKSLTVGELSPEADTALDYTDWWYSEWDDMRYIFLPATADRNSLVISYTAEDTLYLNGEAVASGEYTDLLGKADTFDIKVGDTDCGTLKVMQSNLGCIYISTSKGGLDALDKNRAITETGTVLMLNAEGGTEYSGALEKLTAHGNSSWDYSKKKPYNIKLPKKADLYGMGKAKKWVLLSNYLDHSMLRNKLTEEMCRAAGIDCVMDSVFVDLYADGSYRGTYQLYEKVQVQKNRVDIRDLAEETEKLNDKALSEYERKVLGAETADEYMENSYKYYDIPNAPEDITGGYLLQFQQWNRYGSKADSGFVTSRGQAISIESPEYASRAQAEYIRGFVQDMEDAIYSDTGYNDKGKHYSDYFDVDSLVKAYLVQEISMNIDATYSSFYLWKDSELTGDGKIHFSPAWDFDLAYNNFPTYRTNSDGNKSHSGRTDSLFAANFPIHGYDDGGVSSSSGSGRPAAGRSWIGQLYRDETFVKRAAQIYHSSFEPFLGKLTGGEAPLIKQYAEDIRPSAEMSNARWHTYGGKKYLVFGSSSGEDFMGSVELVRSFIEKRSKWLSEYWSPYIYVRGDVNNDGVFSIADIAALQGWLLGKPDTAIEKWRAADMCEDNCLDVFDLHRMRYEMLYC